MDRRTVLHLAGLTLVAGCSSNPPRATGPRTPPTPSEPTATEADTLRVTDQDVEAADDGHLRVLVTVTNRSGAERTGTLVVRVTVGGTAAERRRDVTVAGGDDLEVPVAFEDIAFEDFSGNGSVQSRLS